MLTTENTRNIKVLVLPLSSDKGLCGGINSGVAKHARNRIVEEEKKGNTVDIVCQGNKAPTALKRLFGDR